MGLYQRYYNKIKAIVKAKNFVILHRIPILILLGIMMLMFVSFLSTKGIVTEITCPPSITYGSDYEFESKALFADTTYEYRAEDSDEWTSEKPTIPGTYYVRAKSTRTFGAPSYSKELAFVIERALLTIEVSSDIVPYGDEPNVSANLLNGDVITDVDFIYDSVSTANTLCQADASSIIIKNTEGVDVTNSYIISCPKKDISFGKRSITIQVNDKTKPYDGTLLTSNEFEIVEGSLVEGDVLTIECSGSVKDVRSGKVKNNVQGYTILDKDGNNVSINYDLTSLSGYLEISPINITVTSNDATKVYDGTVLSNNSYSITEGELLENNNLRVISSTEISNVSLVANNLNIVIEDNDGNDVTSNYRINQQTGQLRITPRVLDVQTLSGTFLYDGLEHSLSEYTLVDESQLLTGDVITIANEMFLKNVGKAVNRFNLQITSNSIDVTNNYQINYDYGTIEITPRDITINTLSEEKVYDGTELYNSNCTFDQSVLVAGHDVRVVDYAKFADVMRINNTVSVEIYDVLSNEDVTDNYNISYNFGTLEITRRYNS